MTVPPADCDPGWDDGLPAPTTHLKARYMPDGRPVEDVAIADEITEEYL